MEVESMHRRLSVEEELQRLDALAISASLPEGFLEKSVFGERLLEHKHIPVVINIIHGSIWGVVARRGINQLTGYGGYLGGVVWSNFVACLIMGLLVNSETLWLNLKSKKAGVPLYIGLATGFCGTFSSFSSLILESFLQAIDTAKYPNSGYGIMEFLSVTIAQVGISFFGYSIGKEIMEYGDKYCPRIDSKFYHILEVCSMSSAVILYITDIILIATVPASRLWTFSILFAPFGALLRFGLGKRFNLVFKIFPLGTFIANVLGSLLLAIFTLISRGKIHFQGRIIESVLTCQVLAGLDDGFCGGLTTVSTFVVELSGLRPMKRFRYGVVSVLASFCLMVLTLGSYNWTNGLTNAICGQ